MTLEMSALLPELLPETKNDAVSFQNTASETGGATGTRTPDPLLAKQMLSQLSYRPENSYEF